MSSQPPRIGLNHAFMRIQEEIVVLGNRFDDKRSKDIKALYSKIQALMSEATQLKNEKLSQDSSQESKSDGEGGPRRGKRLRNTPTSPEPGSSSTSTKLDFIELIKKNAKVSKIDVEEAITAAGGFEEFADADGIDLSNKSLGKHLLLILQGLELLPKYRKMFLASNEITEKHLQVLTHQLQQLQQLQLLDLSGNEIEGHLSEFFNHCKDTLPLLKTLIVSDCQLKGFQFFDKVFSVCTGLANFDLSRNYIRAEDLTNLSRAFPPQCSLTDLNLSNNYVMTGAITSLNHLLGRCTRLTNLDLSHNDIGDEGIQLMAIGMPVMASLQILKLSSTEISSLSLSFFSTLFLRAPELTDIHLSGNRIRDIKELPLALSHAGKLRFVDLSGCQLTTEAIVTFSEELAKVRHTVAMISFNEIFTNEETVNQHRDDSPQKKYVKQHNFKTTKYKGNYLNFQEWKAIVDELKGFKDITVLL